MGEIEDAFRELEQAMGKAEEWPLTELKDRTVWDARQKVAELDAAVERGFQEPHSLGQIIIDDEDFDIELGDEGIGGR